MIGVAGESMEWIKHPHYQYYIESLKLEHLLEHWENVPIPPAEDCGMFFTEAVCNRKTIILGGFQRTLLSTDGGNHWRSVNNKHISSIIFGNNQYVAIEYDRDYNILTSNDGVTWNKHPNNNRIIQIVYDDIGNVYRGIDDCRNMYVSRDVATLGQTVAVIRSPLWLPETKYPLSCRNGISLLVESNEISYIHRNSWKRAHIGNTNSIKETTHAVSYNSNGKCFVALIEYCRPNFKCVYTSKNGRKWKVRLAIPYYSLSSASIGIIGGYSVVLIRSLSTNSEYKDKIYFSKKGLRWRKIPNVKGICADRVKQLVDIGDGALMITNNGIRKAVRKY
jgi:hypothetical protein